MSLAYLAIAVCVIALYAFLAIFGHDDPPSNGAVHT